MADHFFQRTWRQRRRLGDTAAHEVKDGETVRIEADGWLYDYDDVSAFIINHACANGDVVLSFNVLSQNGGVEENSLVGGQWGTATSSSMPSGLSATTPFKLDFTKEAQKWQVSVNEAVVSSLDFTSSASCSVVSTTLTPNVQNGRIMLLPSDEVVILGMDGPSAVIHAGILVTLILVIVLVGCICGRLSKGSRTSESVASNDVEEKQSLVGQMVTAAPSWKSITGKSGSNGAAKEWFYLSGSAPKGPFGNEEMLRLFKQIAIHPGTRVKLVWHESYVPLEDLYPQGKEFSTPPLLIGEKDINTMKSTYLRNDGFSSNGGAWVEYEVMAPAEVQELGLCPGNMPPGKVAIKSCTEGGWAAEAGIEAGHSIVKANGASMESMTKDSFRTALRGRPLRLTLEKPSIGTPWYYKALTKEIVGPIDVQSMRYYFLREFIKPSTPVRSGESGSFSKVESLFPDTAQAFYESSGPTQTPALPPRYESSGTPTRMESNKAVGFEKTPAVDVKCKSCNNTGMDFMGNPCTCEAGQKNNSNQASVIGASNEVDNGGSTRMAPSRVVQRGVTQPVKGGGKAKIQGSATTAFAGQRTAADLSNMPPPSNDQTLRPSSNDQGARRPPSAPKRKARAKRPDSEEVEAT